MIEATNKGQNFSQEIAPHKKKSKTSSKSNSSKRSDHKHNYENVVIEVETEKRNETGSKEQVSLYQLHQSASILKID